MKCYQCGHQVDEQDAYCENCGAMLRPTKKLFEQVCHGNHNAIISLLKMTYQRIVNTMLVIGLDDQRSQNIAEKMFIESLQRIDETNADDYLDWVIALAVNEAGHAIEKENLPLIPQTDGKDVAIDAGIISRVLSNCKSSKTKKFKKKRHVT